MNQNKIINGVYDISIEEYHNGQGVSRSSLMEMAKSPLHYWHKCINPNREQRESPAVIEKRHALEFGNALHTYILEPPKYLENYHLMPEANRTTKIGKEIYAKALNEANRDNKSLISVDAHETILEMTQSINNHPAAPDLIRDAFYEKSLYWTDEETGILCKVRPDIWHSNFICDLKTAQSASENDFKRSIYSYGYHIQAGMIHEALKNVTGVNMQSFLFVVVEKEAPYAVAVYQLDETALEQGIIEFKNLLRKLKSCINTDHWPSYPSTLISLPNYVIKG
jgi:hypothetical protein